MLKRILRRVFCSSNILAELKVAYPTRKNFDEIYLKPGVDTLQIISQVIGNDIRKVEAFLKFREETVTQIELTYCLNVIASKPDYELLLKENPELLSQLTESLSKVQVVSFDTGLYFFELVSTFYRGCTPNIILMNLFKHASRDLDRWLYDQNDVDSIVPLDDLLEIGVKPSPQKNESVLDFLKIFFEHLADQEGKELRNDNYFTGSYELEEFFSKMYKLIPTFTVSQALRLLHLFYTKVILTLPTEGGRVEIDKEFEVVQNDRLANMPILDYLDLFFAENGERLTVGDASDILFINAKSRRNDSNFANRFVHLFDHAQSMAEDRRVELVQKEDGYIPKLVWGISKFNLSESAKDATWDLLDSWVMRRISKKADMTHISPQEIGILISSFYESKLGSDGLWLLFSKYCITNSKLVSVSLKCLVFITLYIRGLLKEGSEHQKYAYVQLTIHNVPLWNLADLLSADKSPKSLHKLHMILTLLFYHMKIHQSSNDQQFAELSIRVQVLLSKQTVRKLFGDCPMLSTSVIEVIQRSLVLGLKRAHGDKALMVNTFGDGGWGDVHRLLYYIERKLDDYSALFPFLLYLRLGALHLSMGGVESEFTAELTIRRRVFHHECMRRIHALKTEYLIKLLHMMFIENYEDEQMLSLILFKLIPAIDGLGIHSLVLIAYLNETEDTIINLIKAILHDEELEDHAVDQELTTWISSNSEKLKGVKIAKDNSYRGDQLLEIVQPGLLSLKDAAEIRRQRKTEGKQPQPWHYYWQFSKEELDYR